MGRTCPQRTLCLATPGALFVLWSVIMLALEFFSVRLCFPPPFPLLDPEQRCIPPGFWCPLRMHVAFSGLGVHNPSESQLIACWASLGSCSVAKPSPTLFNPRDCSPPGSSVRGISQARVLEWVAISFSKESSQPID